jgi:hypothetical protein
MLQKITKQTGKRPDCPNLRLIAAHQALEWGSMERFVTLFVLVGKGHSVRAAAGSGVPRAFRNRTETGAVANISTFLLPTDRKAGTF